MCLEVPQTNCRVVTTRGHIRVTRNNPRIRHSLLVAVHLGEHGPRPQVPHRYLAALALESIARAYRIVAIRTCMATRLDVLLFGKAEQLLQIVRVPHANLLVLATLNQQLVVARPVHVRNLVTTKISQSTIFEDFAN